MDTVIIILDKALQVIGAASIFVFGWCLQFLARASFKKFFENKTIYATSKQDGGEMLLNLVLGNLKLSKDDQDLFWKIYKLYVFYLYDIHIHTTYSYKDYKRLRRLDDDEFTLITFYEYLGTESGFPCDDSREDYVRLSGEIVNAMKNDYLNVRFHKNKK